MNTKNSTDLHLNFGNPKMVLMKYLGNAYFFLVTFDIGVFVCFNCEISKINILSAYKAA